MARRRTPPRTSGFLNIDKPPGWTSHDVVARVRRIVGERGVGHAGTLDPAATGVLPVAVGYATRLLPFIESAKKSYIATIRFGVETDSGDRDGRLLSRGPLGQLNEDAIRAALSRYSGMTQQVPPIYSAIRVGGQRLYELARNGEAVDIPVRHIEIHHCDLVSYDGLDAIISVSCSKGTYIRSLARDIGRDLGCGATLANLVRTQAGSFHLRSSISVHDLEASLASFGWEWVALHPDFVLSGLDIVTISPSEEVQWFNGQEIARSGLLGDVRVYTDAGEWVGIGVCDDDEAGILQPRRVILGNRK